VDSDAAPDTIWRRVALFIRLSCERVGRETAWQFAPARTTSAFVTKLVILSEAKDLLLEQRRSRAATFTSIRRVPFQLKGAPS